MKRDPEEAVPVPRNTKAKILDAALHLFNERGTAAVSTNHIAEGAGIAVGNFYYHFKNREEIVRHLFDRNVEETRVAFRPPADASLTLDVLEKMVAANYEILWRYRFLYRELNVLLNRDPELAQAFRAHRHYGFGSFELLIAAYAEAGVMKPIQSPEVKHRLAVTVWLVSEFYIPFLESHHTGLPENIANEGTALLRQVLEPYLAEVTHHD
ncbi:MAG: TetR/AcrR family transcriptional regulator [Fimbriimonas sp.]